MGSFKDINRSILISVLTTITNIAIKLANLKIIKCKYLK